MVKDEKILEIFNEELFKISKTESGRIHLVVKDVAYVNVTNLYAAIEFNDGAIKVGMMMVKHYTRRMHWNSFRWETDEEHRTTYFHDCPERILNILTEPENTNSKLWREYCWNKIKQHKAFPQYKKGQVLVKEIIGDIDSIYLIEKVNAKSLYVLDIDKENKIPLEGKYRLNKDLIQIWLDNNGTYKVYTDDLLELEIKTAMLSN